MSPVTIPNPTTLLSYQKAVDAGLVDKSYQKAMAKKVQANGDRIGWSRDSEFSHHAGTGVLRGIGAKYASALGPMSVYQFATTRGGFGFAALEPMIGKEGVTNLRNLQAALKACMMIQEEPVAPAQVSAERFAELFAHDFNGHDVESFANDIAELIHLANTKTGAEKSIAIDMVSSAVAYELLRGSLAAVEQGVDLTDLGYQLQQLYHNVLGQFPNDLEKVGKSIESLLNQYAGYLPENLQRALGLEPGGEPTPVSSAMTSEQFMAEFGTSFNGRNVTEITIEDLMLDLDVTTDPAERKALLDDLVAFIGFGVMYGSIAMHEGGMAADEIATSVDETLAHMGEVCKTAAEGEYVIGAMVEAIDAHIDHLPEVVQMAISDIMPS